MNARVSVGLYAALAIALLTGGAESALGATMVPQNDIFAGRHADHLPLWTARMTESADFAAMETSSVAALTEPVYAGRRADHVPQVLGIGVARSDFAAMETTAAQGATTSRSEPAYAGRRADHLELLR